MILKIVLFCGFLVLCLGQYEGDSCTDNGKTGTCVSAAKCQSAIEAIQKKKRPKICGFNKSDPIVCCFNTPGVIDPVPPAPPTPPVKLSPPIDPSINSRGPENEGCQPIPAATEKPIGWKAFDKCIEYQEKYVYPCTKGMSILGTYSRSSNCHHNADELILGGVAAARDEFPHMVMVRYGFDEKTKQYLCGGSIISESYILTAAHCIEPAVNVDITHVIVGALTMSEGENKLNRYVIKQIIKHPEYNPPERYNDIALLRTERPIKLNQYLVPACLHIGDPVDDSRVLATGWGQTRKKDASSVSETLQKAILYKFNKEECDPTFISIASRYLGDGVDYQTQTCYGHFNESVDTCQGDSGGPIQIKSKRIHCMYIVVGVTSFGKGCGYPGDPALYTKVSHYVPWIESIVWP